MPDTTRFLDSHHDGEFERAGVTGDTSAGNIRRFTVDHLREQGTVGLAKQGMLIVIVACTAKQIYLLR